VPEGTQKSPKMSHLVVAHAAAAAHATVRLDALPAEIIKRIASYLPCLSAIALLKTGRRIHSLVDDRLVFKAMLERRYGRGGQDAAWLDNVDLSVQLRAKIRLAAREAEGEREGRALVQRESEKQRERSMWARLALADEKAQEWVEQQRERAHAVFPPPPSNTSTSPWSTEEMEVGMEMDPGTTDTAGDDGSPAGDSGPQGQDWNNIMSWAPHLMVLHHPVLRSLPVYALLERFAAMPDSHNRPTAHPLLASGNQFQPLELVLSMLVLQCGVPTIAPSPPSPPPPPPPALPLQRQRSRNIASQILGAEEDEQEEEEEEDPHILDTVLFSVRASILRLQHPRLHYMRHLDNENFITPLTLFLCALIDRLRALSLSLSPNSNHNHNPFTLPAPTPTSPLLLPPIPSHVPFISFMPALDLAILFSPGAVENFRAVHLGGLSGSGSGNGNAMLSVDFLTAAPWTAYYSSELDFQPIQPMVFMPPMVDVRFTVVSALTDDSFPSSSSSSSSPRPIGWNLSATGSDPAGPTHAIGEIRANGSMVMRETNYHGTEWIWRVWMTPLGLFGTWGPPDHDGAVDVENGWLWLFRRDWGGVE